VKANRPKFPVAILLAALLFKACSNTGYYDYSTWANYGGTKDANRYSSIDQINSENVSQLKVAWVFNTGDKDTANNRSEIQCNPIVIGGTLYLTSSKMKLFALDPATGKQKWVLIPLTIQKRKLGLE